MKYDRNIFHHDKVLIFDIESRTADWVFSSDLLYSKT